MNEKRTSVERVMAASTGLKRTMKTKAAIMVGVGSTIGTGLFLSSGDVISSAGPGGAIVAYLIGGFIAWLMTSCLGEMSAAMPVSGSLQAYSTEFIGPAMGFTIGWVNWIGAAATITAQIVAAAIIMQDIIPGTPTWLWIVVFSLLLFGVNFFNAKAFGNISFWVSSLKMILVVVFIIIGIAMMLGVTGGGAVGLSNYTRNGGLFPMGIAGIGAVILTSFYAYAGTEMVASTAGEIENEKDMPKAINLTIIILIAATVLSIAIVAALLPWNQASVLGSPFVYVFRNAGLKSAALVVNVIVLTSALTSGNYFVYACSRYLWSMAKFHQAPKICAKTSKSGVPVVALTISMLFAMVGIIAEFVAQDTVYLFLVYFIGGGNIFMYSVICICQYRFRKRYLAEGGRLEDLNFKVASYPLVPILGVLAFAAMLVVTLLDPSEAVAIYVCAPCYLAIYIVSRIYTKKKGVAAANLDI
ncbi:amino acid permease [Emergencia timonensis]|uniref:amino acid permease n=1 Tax=Emergencia timonensis TaxID=1776384 RepID=UPI00399472DD